MDGAEWSIAAIALGLVVILVIGTALGCVWVAKIEQASKIERTHIVADKAAEAVEFICRPWWRAEKEEQ